MLAVQPMNNMNNNYNQNKITEKGRRKKRLFRDTNIDQSANEQHIITIIKKLKIQDPQEKSIKITQTKPNMNTPIQNTLQNEIQQKQNQNCHNMNNNQNSVSFNTNDIANNNNNYIPNNSQNQNNNYPIRSNQSLEIEDEEIDMTKQQKPDSEIRNEIFKIYEQEKQILQEARQSFLERNSGVQQSNSMECLYSNSIINTNNNLPQQQFQQQQQQQCPLNMNFSYGQSQQMDDEQKERISEQIYNSYKEQAYHLREAYYRKQNRMVTE